MTELVRKYAKDFEKLFEVAEIARFTPDQVRSYEDNLKYYRVSPDRDLKNSLDTAFDEGKEEGREQGMAKGIAQVAREMLKNNVPIKKIAEYTGMTVSQIEQLK